MDIEAFRTFCMSFPGTSEGMPFQGFFKNSRSILVFYVGRKMFCFFDIDQFDYCTLKCDPEAIEELTEKKGFQRPFNLSRKYWISVSLDGAVSDEVIKSMVRASYELVSENKKNKTEE